MTAQIAIVDAATLQAILDKLDAVQRSLEAAQIRPKPDWVSIPEAMAHYGCSADTIRRRVASGALKARGSGKLKQVLVAP